MSEYRLGIKWDQSRLSKLVVLWNTSRTVDEVCKRMGAMYSEVMPQVQRLRTQGVQLKKYRARVIDWNALKQLAEKHPPANG